MEEPKQIINYNHANIYLNREELYFQPKEKENLKSEDKIFYNENNFCMLIGDYELDIQDITLPLQEGLKEPSKKKIINSIEKIVGDCAQGLKRCAELAKKGIIQENLYFTPYGLLDYSYPQSRELDGKTITGWVWEAQNYPSTIEELLPESIEKPKNFIIEFVPTFNKLRSIKGLGSKKSNESRWEIRGTTFAERIDNLLNMYGAIVAHIKWEKQKRRELFLRERKSGERVPDTIPVSKLVLKK